MIIDLWSDKRLKTVLLFFKMVRTYELMVGHLQGLTERMSTLNKWLKSNVSQTSIFFPAVLVQELATNLS